MQHHDFRAMPTTTGLSLEKWWAYVVKHEIEPTLHSYCQPPLITTPITTIALKQAADA